MFDVEILNTDMLAKQKNIINGRHPYLHRELEIIVAELSEEYGYDKKEIRKIVASPYNMFKAIRSHKELKHAEYGFPAMRIPYIGMFVARPHFVKHYLENRKAEKKDVYTEQ